MKNHNKSSKNISRKEDKTKAIKILIFLLIIVAIIVLILTFIPKFETTEKEIATPKEACKSFCETNQRTLFCFAKVYQNDIALGTCDQLALNSEYGVERCDEISCEVQIVDKTCASGLNGSWETPEVDGSCPQIEGKILRAVKSTDNPEVEGQICCREILG